MTTLRSGRPIVLGPVHLVVLGLLLARYVTRNVAKQRNCFSLLPSKPRISGAYLSRRERMVQVSCCLSLSRAAGEPESRVFPCGFAGRLTRRNLCVKPGLTRRGLRASHHHWRGTVEPTTGRGGRCERVEEDEPELSASEHA